MSRGTARVICGECVAEMEKMEAGSFDLCLTDPPYDLTSRKAGGTGEASLNLDSPAGRARVTTGGFMGKHWDATGVAFKVTTWQAVYRVLKPGGHLVAFGGTRTHHRLMCAIEDAGFEIRDVLMWLYGSGFPKSMDISKAIRKRGKSEGEMAKWEGYGTALKPAFEPIVWAMKPLDGTFAANAERHGVAGVNIDGARVDFVDPVDEAEAKEKNRHADFGSGARENRVFGADERARGENGNYNAPGRWPANVVLGCGCEQEAMNDEREVMSGEREQETQGTEGTKEGHLPGCAVRMLDEQAGPQTSGGTPQRRFADKTRNCYGVFAGEENPAGIGGSSGLVSRFFYTAKAGADERWFFCAKCGEALPMYQREEHGHGIPKGQPWPHVHAHPTQKPTELMEYLLKLFDTPSGGKVLDPFCGSGTTLVAAARLHREAVGIEREAEYVEIARARVSDPRSIRGDGRPGKRRRIKNQMDLVDEVDKVVEGLKVEG